MNRGFGCGGCLTALVLISLGGVFIVGIGFWPMMFFSALPWWFKACLWVSWLSFAGTGIALLVRKNSRRRDLQERLNAYYGERY